MIKTFKGKLIFGTLAITSIANLILTFYISKNLNLNFQNKIETDMNNIKIVAMNNVKFNSKVVLGEEADDIPRKTILDIRNNFKHFVAMANKDGELIDYSGNLYYEDVMREIIEESQNKKSLLKLSNRENYYLATYNYPIYIDGEFYCNLIVQNNYINEYRNKNETLLYIILGQVTLLIMLSFAIKNMINRMTDPLKTLANSMREFAEGNDVENIVINSNDEIEEISNSFNSMKEDIKNQIDIIVKEKEKIVNLQKVSEEFFNNATHELKTPITAISGYSQMLRESIEGQDEFTERALDRTLIECRKMQELIQNILDISRGTFKNEEKIDINFKLLVESILKGMEVRTKRSNIIIKASLEDVNILGIKSEVEQILINLIDNAIKYIKGTVIEINLSKVEEEIIFKIKNTCNTIPDNIKDKLLDPFVKYNLFTEIEKRFITSSGLGLYLCNEIAKRNGFKLTYEILGSDIIFKLMIKM